MITTSELSSLLQTKLGKMQFLPSGHLLSSTAFDQLGIDLLVSPVAQMVKNLSSVQETWVQSLSQEGSPGEENGYPLQYSCLENSMDREAWQATVHGVSKSQTHLSD